MILNKPSILTYQPTISHLKSWTTKITTYGDGVPGTGMRRTQIGGGVKHVNGIPSWYLDLQRLCRYKLTIKKPSDIITYLYSKKKFKKDPTRYHKTTSIWTIQ